MPRYDVNRTQTIVEVEWVTVEAASEEEALQIGRDKWKSGDWDAKGSECVDTHGDAEWSVEPYGGNTDGAPRYFRCGGCECYHPKGWTGDCRDDDHRFTADALDEKHGATMWEEVDE